MIEHNCNSDNSEVSQFYTLNNFDLCIELIDVSILLHRFRIVFFNRPVLLMTISNNRLVKNVFSTGVDNIRRNDCTIFFSLELFDWYSSADFIIWT